jgi:hypothetical protein
MSRNQPNCAGGPYLAPETSVTGKLREGSGLARINNI